MKTELIGKKSSMLTIQEFSHTVNNGSYWICICECGNKKLISSGEFNRNRAKVKSCGCYKKPAKDLTGLVFGKFTVLKCENKIKTQYYWSCLCECGNKKIMRGESLTRNLTKDCGCVYKEKLLNLRLQAKERLKKRIIIENECWIWTGGKDKNGYGCCGNGYEDQRAHRASFKAFKGDIPKGMFVCHLCDNPSCINPDHLYPGTPKDNVRDAILRGQFPKGKNKSKGLLGEKNTKAKLKESDIFKIREFFHQGWKNKDLSKVFGVHKTQITRIITGKSWVHV